MKNRIWIGLLALTLTMTPIAESASQTSSAPSKPQPDAWRLGVSGWGFHRFTLFEAIDKVHELGLHFYDGISFQKVSKEINRPFDAQLSPHEIATIQRKLAATDVRIPVLYYARFPSDEEACRQVFEFGKTMGIETFVSEPAPDSLDRLESFCDQYQINLALHNHGPEQSPPYWYPEKVLKHCQDRSKRISVCPDTGYWMRAGIDPVTGIALVADRLITLQLHDLNERTPEGHDVPWGTGVGDVTKVLHELHRRQVTPTLIGIEYSYAFEDNLAQISQSIQYYKQHRNKLK